MKYFSLLIFMIAITPLRAQELRADVKVVVGKIANADPKIFKTLEQSLTDFINGQKWTSDYFEEDERIKCNFQLTITAEEGNNVFRGELAIKSVRPIYNSDQETVLFSHLDKDLKFSYQEFQPIQFVRDNYTDELSSVFAFYAYTILGLDYDSFQEMGGTQYFQEAGNIVNIAPKDLDGWKSGKDRNRFAIYESITNARSIPFRKAFYEYHRLGLDVMAETPDIGRKKILSALEKIERVSSDYINAFIIQIFVNTKTSELVEIFKQGTSSEKARFISIMSKLDATKMRIYRQVGV